MQSLQQAFESLVKNPKQPEASECLKSVALALWYENFVPSLNKLEGADAAQAGFMLDKLTRYNCVERFKKEQLRLSLLPQLQRQKQGYNAHAVKDKLASYWGAAFEMKSEFRSLLPYQRRSFQHPQTQVAA